MFAQQKKSSVFQQNAFDFLGFRTPVCGCKSGYMSHSATGAICEPKNLMYIYLIKMIPDIGYDIRYDIMYDTILILSVPWGSCSGSGDLKCQMDSIVPWVCH